MFDDIVINGGRKLPRKPSLDRYDLMRPVNSVGDNAVVSSQFFNWNGQFDKNAPRGHAAAKAELVAFGVNGEVPLAQARINCGLDEPAPDPDGGIWVPRWRVPGVLRELRRLSANDNMKSAALAA